MACAFAKRAEFPVISTKRKKTGAFITELVRDARNIMAVPRKVGIPGDVVHDSTANERCVEKQLFCIQRIVARRNHGRPVSRATASAAHLIIQDRLLYRSQSRNSPACSQ